MWQMKECENYLFRREMGGLGIKMSEVSNWRVEKEIVIGQQRLG